MCKLRTAWWIDGLTGVIFYDDKNKTFLSTGVETLSAIPQQLGIARTSPCYRMKICTSPWNAIQQRRFRVGDWTNSLTTPLILPNASSIIKHHHCILELEKRNVFKNVGV